MSPVHTPQANPNVAVPMKMANVGVLTPTYVYLADSTTISST